MGDELWLYYGGYKLGHKVGMKTERKIGLAKMPMDRFVSRRAGNVTGTLTTVPFAWPAESRELTVNADLSAGELRVEALDEDGYPITELPARAGGLDELLGRVVHLKFHLRNADLFGFGFKAGAAR